jgi:DNA-binding NtrC family response regulator
MESRILIVDDEPHILKALNRTLVGEGYEIMTAASGDEALELVRRYKFKVVISDERMPGMYGSELLSTISVRQPEVVKMLLTGYASVEAAIRAVNEGEICRFLVKPWDDFELKMAIRMAIERYDLEMKNRKLQALVRTQYYRLKGTEKGHISVNEAEEIIGEMGQKEIDDLIRECGVEV